MQDQSHGIQDTKRPERVISHALVELKRHKWWPLGIKSAVLLDISKAGFKIEFTSQVKVRSDETLYMDIPLSPFGISAPRSILVQVSVKWFDPDSMRVGGVFLNIDDKTLMFLEKIIDKVKEQDLNS